MAISAIGAGAAAISTISKDALLADLYIIPPAREPRNITL